MGLNRGYKQTEVGVIPEDWDEATLGDKTTKVGSGITPTGGERVYKQEGRPFLRSQNVGWGTLLLQDIAFIDDATHEVFKGTEIEADDLLLTITGASIGRSAVADVRIARGNVNQHVCIIRTDQEKLQPRFLNYFLLSETGQRQIDSFQAGGNRQGLNFGQIRSFRIPAPPLAEQRAIVDALGDVDALLDRLAQLIAKKRHLKRAVMQQILTGHTRLPGFRGEWKARLLKEIGTFSKGKGIRKDEVVAEGLPCIRYGEIYTHHNDYIRDFLSFIPVDAAKRSRRLRPGDLLFAGSGETAEEIGKCVAFLGDVEAYAGSDIVILTPSGHNSMYLGYLMNHPSIARQKARLGQGDAVVHISARNLAQVSVRLPDEPEQTAIATVLSDLDAELAALELRLAKTRALKQGMMQELLTGRTRLV
jgi:type I restriction enzyme S subunit